MAEGGQTPEEIVAPPSDSHSESGERATQTFGQYKPIPQRFDTGSSIGHGFVRRLREMLGPKGTHTGTPGIELPPLNIRQMGERFRARQAAGSAPTTEAPATPTTSPAEPTQGK